MWWRRLAGGDNRGAKADRWARVMAISKPFQIAATVVRRPAVFVGRRRYILVISHMRSYSSLLCHILGSNPEIAGYAEMHQSYERRLDLFRLRMRVSRALDGCLPGRFVLDKVLHDEYTILPEILDWEVVKPIFLLRRPEATLRSIMKMGERIKTVEWYSDQDSAMDYYVARLNELARLADQMQTSALFIQSERLIDSTALTLESLRTFIGFDEPLREFYSMFKHTGQRGWGDDSSAILEGRILHSSDADDTSELERWSAQRAVKAYEECCRTFERHRKVGGLQTIRSAGGG
jgi:hypothetical protein